MVEVSKSSNVPNTSPQMMWNTATNGNYTPISAIQGAALTAGGFNTNGAGVKNKSTTEKFELPKVERFSVVDFFSSTIKDLSSFIPSFGENHIKPNVASHARASAAYERTIDATNQFTLKPVTRAWA